MGRVPEHELSQVSTSSVAYATSRIKISTQPRIGSLVIRRLLRVYKGTNIENYKGAYEVLGSLFGKKHGWMVRTIPFKINHPVYNIHMY